MKDLYTVDVSSGERILVPFDSSRSCEELQDEITRRIEADEMLNKEGYRVIGLRVSDQQGPRLFKDDILSDVVLPKGSGYLAVFVVMDRTLQEPPPSFIPTKVSPASTPAPPAVLPPAPSSPVPKSCALPPTQAKYTSYSIGHLHKTAATPPPAATAAPSTATPGTIPVDLRAPWSIPPRGIPAGPSSAPATPVAQTALSADLLSVPTEFTRRALAEFPVRESISESHSRLLQLPPATPPPTNPHPSSRSGCSCTALDDVEQREEDTINGDDDDDPTRMIVQRGRPLSLLLPFLAKRAREVADAKKHPDASLGPKENPKYRPRHDDTRKRLPAHLGDCDLEDLPQSDPSQFGLNSNHSSDGASDDDIHWYFGQSSSQIRYQRDHRVEWVVPDLEDKLRHCAKGSRIFSPEFHIYGIPLALVFYPTGNTNAKPGYCSLGLKAPHGFHLRYKLFVGNSERYTELRHNVTESWGFVDMCRIEDEIHGGDFSRLAIGVEVISDIDKDEVTKVSDTKVEWTLRNMKEKMKFYQKDVALYSQEFSLAGVDKLRIKFYPGGKKEAEDDWCSLYLEAPKGSEIRCRLSVGRKSMSFDRIEKFGEDSIWGFLTLCKISDEVDNDEAKLGVDILETKRLDSRLTESEDAYLKSLPSDERKRLLEVLSRIEKLRNNDAEVPSRFRILNLELPDAAKAVALQKWDSLQNDTMSGESSKLKKWIDGLLSLPLGKITKPVVTMVEGQTSVKTYLNRATEALNSAVFGHEEPKEKILQLICQWISNPESMSLVMGIQGPPGNGKTSLCRKGIAEALGRPFVQISLGGATDGAVLEGHSFTYVGSTWGRIAQMLMDARSMNPIIFFDELDKVSETSRGDEIVGVLTHLTDHSQNKIFTDRYFEGIPMDMSKAMFIFSFNDESKINAVLKDRLTIINTQGFKLDQQYIIAQLYLLPELLQNVGMRPGDITAGSLDDLRFLCEYCGLKSEQGVRGLKKALEACVLHANKRRLLELDVDSYKATAEDKRSVVKAVAESPKEKDTPSLPNGTNGAELKSKESPRRSHPSTLVKELEWDEVELLDTALVKKSPDDAPEVDMDASTTAGSPESKQNGVACPWETNADESSLDPEFPKAKGESAKNRGNRRRYSLPTMR
eukprot:GEMP01002642.1.p1 GENE.GEMP01002642.1~~GEMP01002642.1.p1  ORF type:complete len:1136 (+),score=263.71 GEMP01002642.1:180-3587(+)